jgi:hypothetical protein
MQKEMIDPQYKMIVGVVARMSDLPRISRKSLGKLFSSS